MEKELLEECLGEGLSLEAIGKRVGKHESTVSYWLKKHGLAAVEAEKHAAKGAVSKKDLERLLAAGLSLREIAQRLDRSLATIRHWMGKYELKPNPRRKRGAEDGSREMVSRCKRHGETSFVREGRGYYRCKRCRLERVAQRRRTIKRKLVEEAGGKCVICGYSRCQQVLEFHHLDPSLKKFQLSHNGATRSLARSRAEARKCVLLCANCHREVEAGITAVPLNSVPLANPE
ncbi:MAG TPA: helix-turn-helix domain-containing protein [Solirubrobacterales bacterium]|nr:helix-turn-helix domain-containing protein [Solirubrobacterales bacterium]